ncbi:hypothetical protein ACHABX_08800 [Nesterenkonia halotolerans]|uniref:hypothetical protein n=1 Tax=Nesterenkonia halotolerans TaxID=225325 RepID=UPI003EE5F1A7
MDVRASGGGEMVESFRRWRASKRLKEGDGRLLPRFRWWQIPVRALFTLPLADRDDRAMVYAVDVRHWANLDSGKVRAHLYLNGTHRAQSKLPARFPVEGGTVHVAMSSYGIKRCHYVTARGAERELTPDPKSAEGRRATLDRRHPVLSRLIGAFSVLLLLTGIGLNLLQIAEPISQIPPIAQSIGTFESPIHLPLWLNLTLGFGALLASMERALRMQYNPLLDKVGN